MKSHVPVIFRGLSMWSVGAVGARAVNVGVAAMRAPRVPGANARSLTKSANAVSKFSFLLLAFTAICGGCGLDPATAIVVDITTQAVFEDAYDVGEGIWKPDGFGSFSRFDDVVFENGLIDIEGIAVNGTILLRGTVLQFIDPFDPEDSPIVQTSSFVLRAGVTETGSTDPDDRLYRPVAETVVPSGFGFGMNENAFRVLLDGWLYGRESVMESENGQLRGTGARISPDFVLFAAGL